MTLPKSEVGLIWSYSVSFKWVGYFIISFYLHGDMSLMKKEIDEPNPPFCYLLSMLFLLPISWSPPQKGRGLGLGFTVWGGGVDIKIILVYQKTLFLPCQQNNTIFQLLLTMFILTLQLLRCKMILTWTCSRQRALFHLYINRKWQVFTEGS